MQESIERSKEEVKKEIIRAEIDNIKEGMFILKKNEQENIVQKYYKDFNIIIKLI